MPRPPIRRRHTVTELRAMRELDAAVRKLEPRAAAAFRAAVVAVRSEAKLGAISAALAAGDLAGAADLAGAGKLGERLRGVGLVPGEASVQDGLVAGLTAGGGAGQRALPPQLALRATLDLTNPEAVRYLREHLPELIREVDDEARRAVQQALLRGFDDGRDARKIAREVRESVGLTEAQSRAVGNFRRQLESGELGAGAAPWERRLSAAEQQQARSIFLSGGESSARVDALVERYYESLVNRRSRDIARTEVTRAFGAGQDELWSQAAEQGLLDPMKTREVWIVTPDDRLRPAHAEVPDLNPDGVPLGGMFLTRVGQVRGPRESGDPGFDINCRCTKALVFD